MKTIYLFSYKKNQLINSFLIKNTNEFDIKIVRSYSDLLTQMVFKLSHIILVDKPQDLKDLDYRKVIQLKEYFPALTFIDADDDLYLKSIKESVVKLKSNEELDEIKSIRERLSCLTRETNPRLIKEIVHLFLQKLDFYKENFNQLLSQKKFDQISFLAHNLKSSSSNLGALYLASYCEMLEKYNFKEPDLILLQIYINHITFEYQKLSTFLKNYLVA